MGGWYGEMIKCKFWTICRHEIPFISWISPVIWFTREMCDENFCIQHLPMLMIVCVWNSYHHWIMKCDQLIEMRKCPLKQILFIQQSKPFAEKSSGIGKKIFNSTKTKFISLAFTQKYSPFWIVGMCQNKLNTNSCKLLFLIGFTTRHANL